MLITKHVALKVSQEKEDLHPQSQLEVGLGSNTYCLQTVKTWPELLSNSQTNRQYVVAVPVRIVHACLCNLSVEPLTAQWLLQNYLWAINFSFIRVERAACVQSIPAPCLCVCRWVGMLFWLVCELEGSSPFSTVCIQIAFDLNPRLRAFLLAMRMEVSASPDL